MSVDKKIGRNRAGTFGRTTGGYSPKVAKMFKRFGSKGARRVAKNNLKISLDNSCQTCYNNNINQRGKYDTIN